MFKMQWTINNKLCDMSRFKIFIKWRMFGWLSFWLFHFWFSMSKFDFPYFILFCWKWIKLKKKQKNVKWIVCSYPCLSCIGESNSCLNCIDSFVLNQTTCISNDQCLTNGYIVNDTCFGFLFFFSFSYFF